MSTIDLSMRTLARSGGIVGTASVVNALVVVATATVVARNLGAAQFGSYSFAMVTVGLLSIFGLMGLGPIIVRELATSAHEGSPTLAAGLLVTASSGSLALAVFTVGTALGSSLPAGLDTTAAAIVAALVVLSSLQLIAQEVFRGLHRLALASLIGQPTYRLLYLLLVLVVPVSANQQTPITYLSLALVASSISFVAVSAALIIHRAELTWSRPSLSSLRGLARAGMPITASKAADEAAGRLPVLVLVSLNQIAGAGVFSLAATLAKGLLLIQSIGWKTLSPFFARSWVQQGSSKALERTIRGIASASTALAAAGALALLALMQLVLPNIVGAEYADSVPTAAMLALGTVIGVSTGQCGMVLNLTGNQRYAARASVIGLLTAAVLVPVGSLAAAEIGAAAGSATGYATMNVLQAWFARKTTTIRTWATARI